MAGLIDFIMQQRGATAAPMADYTMGAQGGFNMPAPSAVTGSFMPRPMVAPTPMMAPPPPPRPAAEPAGAPMQFAGGQPSVRQSFMQRLLGGPDYQSNNMPVVAQPQGQMQANPMTPQQINWGNPENAADFFRADRALQNLPPEVLRGLLG